MLNRGKSRAQFPKEFIMDNNSVSDHKEIADKFNIFCAIFGLKTELSLVQTLSLQHVYHL